MENKQTAMTPKEKAEELIDKMYNTEHCGVEHIPNKRYCDCTEINRYQAKQCALIAVDEIIDAIDWHEYEVPNDQLKYWFEVEQILKKL